jgi:formate dehydrogenase subunit delta
MHDTSRHIQLVAGRWSLVAGRWSLVAGRWSLVAGRWSPVSLPLPVRNRNMLWIAITKACQLTPG